MFQQQGFFLNENTTPLQGWAQFLKEHLRHPAMDPCCIGRAEEQQGGEEVFAAPRGDQALARMAIAGLFAMDFLSAQAPSMKTTHGRLKAGFVDIDEVCRTTRHDHLAQLPNIGDSLFRMAFLVFQRLFFARDAQPLQRRFQAADPDAKVRSAFP